MRQISKKKKKKLRRGQILFNSSVCVLLVIYGGNNYHRVHTLKHESPRVNTWLLYNFTLNMFSYFGALTFLYTETVTPIKHISTLMDPLSKKKKKKVTNAWLKYTTPAGAHRAVLLLGNIFQSKMWHVLGLFNIYFTACSCVIFDRFGRIYVFKLPIMHLLKRECVWVWTS